MRPSTIPNSSHRSCASNVLTKLSAYSKVRGTPSSPSRSLAFDVHLDKWLNYSTAPKIACRGQDLLRAPPLNDAGVVDLIRVIDYEPTKSINAAAVMLVRTSTHFRYGHAFLQRLEDLGKRKVLQLSAEEPEFFSFICIFLRCKIA